MKRRRTATLISLLCLCVGPSLVLPAGATETESQEPERRTASRETPRLSLGGTDPASSIVEHFRSHGIDLNSRVLYGTHREWFVPYPGEPCFTIITGFQAFRTREEMEQRMMLYSAASMQHPVLNIAMFLPSLRGSDGTCQGAPPPDLRAVQEEFVRVFRLYRIPESR